MSTAFRLIIFGPRPDPSAIGADPTLLFHSPTLRMASNACPRLDLHYPSTRGLNWVANHLYIKANA